MASDSSFDIVAQVDLQEVKNALAQAAKEIHNRYDLKKADVELDLVDDEALVVTSSDEFTLGQAVDVLRTKLVRRGVDLKALDAQAVEDAAGGRARQRLVLRQTIDKDGAKQIVAAIKKLKLKVQASIQGDTVRVSGKSRDDLQTVIAHVKGMDLDLPLVFTNYR